MKTLTQLSEKTRLRNFLPSVLFRSHSEWLCRQKQEGEGEDEEEKQTTMECGELTAGNTDCSLAGTNKGASIIM